jgi:hypothetical protein
MNAARLTALQAMRRILFGGSAVSNGPLAEHDTINCRASKMGQYTVTFNMVLVVGCLVGSATWSLSDDR